MALNLLWSARNGRLNLVREMGCSTENNCHPGHPEILTNTSFYLSIHIIPDPAVTFLGNLYPVVLTLGGYYC